MEYSLFIDAVKLYNDYNAVPVYIIDGKGIVFALLQESMLKNTAYAFFKGLAESGRPLHVFNDIEYYAVMPCAIAGEGCVLITGGYSAHPVSIGYRGRLTLESVIERGRLRDYLLSTPPVDKDEFIKYVNILARMLGNAEISADAAGKSNVSLKKYLDMSLTEQIFDAGEHEIFPYAPESERRILDMVKAGDVEGVKRVNTAFFSDNSEQKIKYSYKIIALITLVTRAAIEAGAETIDAYGLSDLYLAQLAGAKNDRQVADIASGVLPHFAELVNRRKCDGGDSFSPHLVKAEKYIKTHLHFPLTLKEVADSVGVNEKYLSRLFVTCKNEKFTRYVNRLRVAEAKELLTNTDYKLIDIAYSLAFVSESYFIKVFSDICGLTPQKYRNLYKS